MGKLSEYKNLVEITCEYCGKQKPLPPYLAKVQWFCSRECEDKSRWVDLECKVCKKNYSIRKCEAYKSGNKPREYCSNVCKHKDKKNFMPDYSGSKNPNWRGGGLNCMCDNCGIEFIKTKNKKSEHHFCSQKCKNDWTSKNKIGANHHNWKGGLILHDCDYCGKQSGFKKHDYTISKFHFCSHDCHHKHRIDTDRYKGEKNAQWRGGKSFEPYSEQWTNSFRENIRERDSYKCQLCNKKQDDDDRRLAVHHIDYDKLNYSLNNLISLCTSCHGQTHHNRIQWESILRYFINNIKVVA